MEYVIAYCYSGDGWKLWHDRILVSYLFPMDQIKEKIQSELKDHNKDGIFAQYVMARVIKSKTVKNGGNYLILYRTRTGKIDILVSSKLHGICGWPADLVKTEIRELREQKRPFAIARIIDFDIKIVIKR